MSYVVLARKYRPQRFDEVVGQDPVSQTLLNALESSRVAHAYVFSGPRGVGKTTTARLLAKCLNCAKGPTKTPCNECDSCKSINQGNTVDDVLEIDGASNRGIEQIRELRESAKYSPARSRYRIYIIDEAHQITKDAFGALLKTLEEPPPHVVFMLATTEVQKIPAPILSRCQRFSLRPISADLVFKHLKEICKSEKIKVADEALADIVRFVEGSLRDALSLLDQAIVFAPEGITSNTVRDLLGLLPLELIRGFAKTIQAGEPGAILKGVHEAIQNGIDLTQLGKDLQSYYHRLLLTKAGVPDAFKADTQEASKEAATFDFGTLERNIRLLSRALEDMRRSETPRAVFEVHALRLGQKTVDAKELLERLEKIEQAGPVVRAAAPAAPQPSFVRPAPPVIARSEATRQSHKSINEIATPTPPTEPPARNDSTSDFSMAAWSDFVSDVSKIKMSLGSALEEAKVEPAAGRLVLTFEKLFNQELVSRSIETLKPLFEKKFGAWMPFELKLGKPAATSAARPASPAYRPTSATSSTPSLAEDTLEDVAPADLSADIQKALKHFPGAVKRERK